MSILIDKSQQLFTLHTKQSTYQMAVNSHNYLLHCYYGAAVKGQNLSYLIRQYNRGFAANPADACGDRTLSPDTLPQEFSTFGVGDFRESCLDLKNSCGAVAADLRYKDYRLFSGKPALPGLPASYGSIQEVQTLEIDLEDKTSGLIVTLQYSVFEEEDLIARSVRFTNSGNEVLSLNSALSLCIDWQLPEKRDIITFYGRHMGERNLERTPIRHGKIRVDSARGASSPHQSPFVIICDSDAGETQGECYAFSFVYSGSFMAQAEVDQADQLRFVMGINPQNFNWELKPGDTFQAPEVFCCYNSDGFDALSNKLHKFQREHLMRGIYRKKPCPILVNNWEATYFDFNTEKLMTLANAAKKLGVEMLVLDDGWFGKRNDDTTSLGDWWANISKLPGGLVSLGKQLKDIDMLFGLWFEPEMISPDSELMKSHPEWCLHIPNRPEITCRAQCVLNMGLPEVQKYLYTCMEKIIIEAGLSYIKWDMNRSITGAYSSILPPHRQGEVWHRYILGVYALMERLLARFPELLIEGCSSGGGRYDAGMLYYAPQIWGSDNSDAIDRLSIQYGHSFGFPVKSLGSHVSVCPNHQNQRTTPLNTRGIVAMTGSFGYEMDLSKLTESEENEIRSQIINFKKQRSTAQFGTYHRLTNAQKDRWFTAWMTVSFDKEEAIVNVVLISPKPNAPIMAIKLRGLDADATYIDDSGNTYTGSALMNAGLVLEPLLGDYTAIQVILHKV